VISYVESVILEDICIEDSVRHELVERSFECIQKHDDVACISFRNSPDGTVESEELPGFALLSKRDRYRVSCQVGLWNRKILMNLLKNHENAWEFEVFGSKRSTRTRYKYYSIMKNVLPPFDYSWGKPIYRGHWNLEAVKQTEERTGIVIETKGLPQISNMSELPQKRVRKYTVKKIINRVKSLI